MLASILALVVSGPAAQPCSIEGTVKLSKNGAAVAPDDQVVVYVESANPRLEERPEPKSHRIRQIKRQFTPRVQVVMMNDTVEFVNEDKELHSVFSRSDDDTFDFKASMKGKTGDHAFLNSGAVMVQCDRHGWMRTDVLVLKNEHWTRPDAAGRFKLGDLPAGTYVLVFWEPNGAKVKATVKSCKGPVTLEPKELVAEPDPVLVRKDGSEYPPDLRNPY
jgi:plastocyanin